SPYEGSLGVLSRLDPGSRCDMVGGTDPVPHLSRLATEARRSMDTAGGVHGAGYLCHVDDRFARHYGRDDLPAAALVVWPGRGHRCPAGADAFLVHRTPHRVFL